MEDLIIKYIVIIFSHPLFIAVVSIILGSGLIDRINYRKEKRETKRMEAIKLVEEISDKLNNDLTWVFWQIRQQTNAISEGFNEASRDAHSYRLKIKVKVMIYLKDEGIVSDYDLIVKEITKIKLDMRDFNKDDPHLNLIEEHINDLKKKWKIFNDYPIEELEDPYKLYFSWAQVIWYHTNHYLTNILGKALEIQ